eukprot:4514413-Pyramimonas_sp.AAC.1
MADALPAVMVVGCPGVGQEDLVRRAHTPYTLVDCVMVSWSPSYICCERSQHLQFLTQRRICPCAMVLSLSGHAYYNITVCTRICKQERARVTAQLTLWCVKTKYYTADVEIKDLTLPLDEAADVAGLDTPPEALILLFDRSRYLQLVNEQLSQDLLSQEETLTKLREWVKANQDNLEATEVGRSLSSTFRTLSCLANKVRLCLANNFSRPEGWAPVDGNSEAPNRWEEEVRVIHPHARPCTECFLNMLASMLRALRRNTVGVLPTGSDVHVLSMVH